MGVTLDLFLNAVTAGLLLGGFYAAVSVGVAISFGMLDIANLAHPAFIILGAFVAYILNDRFGLDPILAGILALPAFYLLGTVIYRVYYYSFERRGEEALRGLAFFFGILFITEVALILVFGVDYRFVTADYIGPSLHFGDVDLPMRMVVPFAVSLTMVGALQLFLSRSFIGRAILAVSQDSLALKLMRFEFPLACMLPEGLANLLVAGRCASVTHEVDKFSRNMAPTGLAGQAAGVCAAVMARANAADWSHPPVGRIREVLESQGVAVSLGEGAPHAGILKQGALAK